MSAKLDRLPGTKKDAVTSQETTLTDRTPGTVLSNDAVKHFRLKLVRLPAQLSSFLFLNWASFKREQLLSAEPDNMME